MAAKRAQSLGHRTTGTGHVLLGLALEPRGLAHTILRASGADGDAVLDALCGRTGRNPEPATIVPFSMRALETILIAHDSASDLGHDQTGTGHLLAAITTPPTGLVGEILTALSVSVGETHRAATHAVGEIANNNTIPAEHRWSRADAPPAAPDQAREPFSIF